MQNRIINLTLMEKTNFNLRNVVEFNLIVHCLFTPVIT